MVIKKGGDIYINPKSIVIDYDVKGKGGNTLMVEYDNGFRPVSECYPFAKSAENLLDTVMALIRTAYSKGQEPAIDMDELE